MVELLFGIVIGPQVLDLAQSDDFTAFFGNLGLGLLFFFAGYGSTSPSCGVGLSGSPWRAG